MPYPSAVGNDNGRRPDNAMGAKIEGAGTKRIIIEGVKELHGAEHEVIPDRIECGTFMVVAAITNGELELKHCNLDHLIAVTDRLEEVGVKVSRQNGRRRPTCGSCCRRCSKIASR